MRLQNDINPMTLYQWLVTSVPSSCSLCGPCLLLAESIDHVLKLTINISSIVSTHMYTCMHLFHALICRCIPLTKENLKKYVYPGCHSFMTRQCYLLNYKLDHAEENTTLNGLDKILTVTSEDVVSEECKDVIRSLTCAAVYPGCNPNTGLPQGLCEEECVEYITGECAQPIMTSIQLAAASGNEVPLSFLQCGTPLGYVEEHDASFINSSLDIENCINISCKFLQ